jgi:phospholipase/carboxylesterase
MPPFFFRHDVHRRDLLRLAGASLIAAACGGGRGSGGASPADPQAVERLRSVGRLRSRPRAPDGGSADTGLAPLRLSGSDRDGAVYVPAGYRPQSPVPLILTLHGATGSGRRGLRRLQPLADAAGVILLAPDSRDVTWDVALTGGFGRDPEFVDRALDFVFSRYSVDPARLAAEGFSDGASYALSLGLLNGDLFTHVIAFSPGFVASGTRRGKPRVFVSHGLHDQVLPIDRCGRRIVRDLRGDDYDVRYTEFDGGHAVPAGIAGAALEWLAGRG